MRNIRPLLLMLGVSILITSMFVYSIVMAKREGEKINRAESDHELLVAFGLTVADIEKDQDSACKIIQAQLIDMKEQVELFWKKIPSETKNATNQLEEIQRLVDLHNIWVRKLVAVREVRFKHTPCRP